MAIARRNAPDLDGVERRDAIVAAARSLFNEVGYDALTVEDIRSRAGVSRTTFYFYFANKHAAFMAVVAQIRLEWIDSVRAVHATSPIGSIVMLNSTYIARWLHEPQVLMDISAYAGKRNVQKIRGARDESALVEGARGLLRGLVQSHEIEQPSPFLASALSAMSETGVRKFFEQRAEFEKLGVGVIDMLRELSDAWYRVIFGRPAPDYPFEGHQF